MLASAKNISSADDSLSVSGEGLIFDRPSSYEYAQLNSGERWGMEMAAFSFQSGARPGNTDPKELRKDRASSRTSELGIRTKAVLVFEALENAPPA